MASENGADDGATPRELVLEACRRNNVDLLQETIDELLSRSGSTAKKVVADVLNNAVDGVGNHCLHLAATGGAYDVIDLILDQEGVEVDPLDRFEKETPLHKAVRFVNNLPREHWAAGQALVDLLLDAGADARVRNKSKMKPVDVVDANNDELRRLLLRAEYAVFAGDDVVRDDRHGPGGNSASDSN